MKGKATTIFICGKQIKLGDYVKVECNAGTWSRHATVQGKITELWDKKQCGVHQARVDNGWCFHDEDKILEHLKT